MLFTSTTFFYFHLLVLALRWMLPRAAVGPLLLVSSYLFYLSWGPKYGLLVGAMTLATWGIGVGLERIEAPRRRYALVAGAVVALLAVLAYFKYANFLRDQWFALAQLAGRRGAHRSIDIVLPLGVSFFTFEMISYVVDVYRGDKAERSPLRFALYIAYYPHLIAGPIVRAGELLPNLRNPRPFDGALFAEGVFIALAGYFKKMVIADNLAPFADEVFANPGRYSTFATWVGVVAYTGQIYSDFSGYTDIARGASMTLGFPLPDNFDYPYLSRSITEFWRRWHMTLSRWLRDYLYIALGGNRRGTLLQYRNLFLTMLLGGLWHGANWTFVVWGALHGALLALHKLWDAGITRLPRVDRLRRTAPYQVLAALVTLLFVMIAWVFFRATSFRRAYEVLTRMTHARAGEGGELTNLPSTMSTALGYTAVLVALHAFGAWKIGLRANRALPPAARGVYWLAIIVAVYLLAESRASFIYFQF